MPDADQPIWHANMPVCYVLVAAGAPLCPVHPVPCSCVLLDMLDPACPQGTQPHAFCFFLSLRPSMPSSACSRSTGPPLGFVLTAGAPACPVLRLPCCWVLNMCRPTCSWSASMPLCAMRLVGSQQSCWLDNWHTGQDDTLFCFHGSGCLLSEGGDSVNCTLFVWGQLPWWSLCDKNRYLLICRWVCAP